MKNIFYSIVISIILFSCLLKAQWVQTNGPYGGSVSHVAAYLNDIGSTNFLAQNDFKGILLSTDNGRTWSSANTPFSDFSEIVQIGSNIFAGTYSDGVYLSTNNGTSWTPVNNGFPKNPHSYDTNLYVSVSSFAAIGTNIFAGTWGSGVYLSTNNGTGWMPVNKGFPKDLYDTNLYVKSFAVIDTNLFVGTLDKGVFLSTNNGTSWIPVNNGFPKSPYPYDTTRYYDINSFAVIGTNLFAGTDDYGGGGVYHSTNNGADWTSVNTGFPKGFDTTLYAGVSSFAVIGTNLFVGTLKGLFLSANNTSWTEVMGGTRIYSLAVSEMFGNTNLLAGTDNGIFLSTNNGDSWTQTGFASTYVSILGLFPNKGGVSNLIAGGGETYGGTWLSTNNGSSWTEFNLPVLSFTVAPIINESGRRDLFIGTYYGVYVSTDDGVNWEATGLTNSYIQTLIAYSDGKSEMNLFAGGRDSAGYTHVFLSTNNGKSWKQADSGLMNSSVNSFAILQDGTGETNLFAAAWNGVYLSTNNGTSWKKTVNTGLWNKNVTALAVSRKNVFAGTPSGSSSSRGSVFRSTNYGANWQEVFQAPPNNSPINSLAVSGANLFVGAYGGVFLTTNNGETWTEVNTGLANIDVLSLAVSDSELFAGTYGSGVWKRPLNEMITAVENNHNNIPNHFELEQNYPNPFNPITTIRFSIPASEFVILKIYDVLGKEITTLVNEEKPAGNYEIEFNAANLPSGVYFYRIQAGSINRVRKMLLIK